MWSPNVIEWKDRFWDASMPYQPWHPFPDEAIVAVKNKHDQIAIGPAKSFWWGYETEVGLIGEGVIMKAARLDKPKTDLMVGL